MDTFDYDIAVIGRGPVGLTMAMSAAQLGMRTVVIEKHRDLYGLPRAGHVDHEIMRLFQKFGIVDDVLADCYPTTEYVWVNAHGETLLEFDWGEKSVSGYNSDYMQFQPVFESALGQRLAAAPTNTDLLGWQLTSFSEVNGGVRCTIARTETVPGSHVPVVTDETRTITARYLVACDGANSSVRETLGIERDDLGFNEKWLVIDGRKKRDLEFEFDCGQICDPRRPTTVLPLGKRHRRWEWAVLPGEDPESLLTDEAAWRLLGDLGVGPDDLEIVRQLVYTFEARHAKEWRRGPVFLAGDAAHTTPPFMGQGMCSGMRDVFNLAWKMDLVRRGVATDAILDSYEPERSPHAEDWTRISLEAGKVPCTMDPAEAEERDQKFRDGWRPPMPDFPQLRHGIVALDEADRPRHLAGTLSLQRRVDANGKTVLADEIFGTGFTLLGVGSDPAAFLTDAQSAVLRRIGAKVVSVGDHDGATAQDVDNAYADWFADHGICAVLIRPDFYIFGTANAPADVGGLVDDLASKLCLAELAEAPVA
ncbi:MAG: bifunctional 3-(3-hydroxy-phenyl)propionate/3-hydroxycinnamic acid hydroxylase [Pseudomonadota bacterium]|nr:bifunctional 3-(3-hydroxy-phenyl)propionate/3-hydroxycinnamic acid hydroxylase [Pseudomonadota bacterium]